MTLSISMLKKIFSTCILKHKNIISCIPMCYVDCQNVNTFFTLKNYMCAHIVSYWEPPDITL